MVKLRDMTIRGKLTTIIMVVTAAALLSAIVSSVTLEQVEARQRLVEDLFSHAEMVGDNCKAALSFADKEDAKTVLASLGARDSAVYACIYDKGGERFAEFSRGDMPEGILPNAPTGNSHAFMDGYLLVAMEIELDGEIIGSVLLVDDMSHIRKDLVSDVIVSVAILCCALGIGYLLSSRLQKVVSEPILNLAGAAERIGKGDLNHKVQVNSNDELGQLACSFNKMTEDLRETTTSIDNLNREIAERKQAEQELHKTHGQLVEASRRAGMAEVATDVLHNVGNILNSINVTSTLVREKVSNLRVEKLKKVSDMLKEHADDLGTYLTEDSKGKHVPAYLTEIAGFLNDEQVDIIDKLKSLTENVNHIKEIVAVQQSYAKAAGLEVSTSIEELIENAIQINTAGLERHGVRLVSELAEPGMVEIDKQRVLQILVNLISNAKYALSGNGKENKVLTIRAYKHGEDKLRIEVADNGIGIAEENLTRIFEHGFTTKQNGHGFGLHSGALTAKEMGGSLTVHSQGPGHGATFTLELPYNKPVEVMT